MSIAPTHYRVPLESSPFTARIEAQSRTRDWSGWNGYKVPRVVENLSSEYFAVRSATSVMDLTPMEKYSVRGRDARRYLDRLVVRNLSKLKPGRVTYVAWCNDSGRVIDDGTLFMLDDDDYMLCAQHHQLDWLLISAAGFDIDIRPVTQAIAALAVQGPTSYAVLSEAGVEGLSTIKPFDVVDTNMGNVRLRVSRTGYTGDLGYELWMEPVDAAAVWDAVFALNDNYEIRTIGLDALEMVRIEAGFIMPGFDFNTAEAAIRDGYDRSPYEAGLGWIVDLDKGHFTGRRALLAAKDRPLERQLTKIVVDGNKPVGESLIYDRKQGRQVGEIKCAIWSPILKANLALADIEFVNGKLPDPLWASIDYQRELKWHTVWAQCHPRSRPFYVPEHRSKTPPARY